MKMKKNWWKKAVVYQIYPRSFKDSNGDGIGDIRGIIEKLDYIKKLGANVIWLCPIYKSPMIDNGYDIEDYYQIDPVFGTMEDFDNLIDEAGKRDIRVVMDMVLNHCSDKNAWFQKAKENPEGPYGNYFYLCKGKDGKEPNNWRSIFGGSAWSRLAGTDYYYLHIFAEEQPDLNWECRELREEIYRMMNWWLDKGVAGFRMDAITYLKKEEGLPSYPADGRDGLVEVARGALNRPGIGLFFSEMRDRTYGRVNAMTVGEAGGISDEQLPEYISLRHGYFSMIFDFSFCLIDMKSETNLWYNTKKWTPDELKACMYHTHETAGDECWIAPCMENHDQPREIDFYLPEEGRNYYGATMLALMHMMRRGTPFIYQGQELGMRNIHLSDIKLYNDVQTIDQYRKAIEAGCTEQEALRAVWLKSRDNARTPFQWEGSRNAGFTTGTPWFPVNTEYLQYNVAEEENNPGSIFAFWQQLVTLRLHSDVSDVLTEGNFKPYRQEIPSLVAYTRSWKDRTILILCNYGNETMIVPLPPKGGRTLIDNYGRTVCGKEFQLKAFEAAAVLWEKNSLEEMK